MKIAMTASDVSLLVTLLPANLLGPASGMLYDHEGNINAPDGSPLATAITNATADPNWKLNAAKAQLIAYAATARYNKEVGGLTVGNVSYATDRDTQQALTGAYSLAQVNPQIAVSWKLPNGTFTTLNAAAITAAASAVGTFVQACFAAEAAAVVGINSGTITTSAQVDAQFASVGAS